MTDVTSRPTGARPGGRAVDHEVVVLGAGVAGLYAIKRLTDLGVDAIVLEADDDLGGTWYRNRYPGARFDSESYTYGYSFSEELLAEWDWSERFSGQPENLRYLRHVADRFGLRRHLRFGCRVSAMRWDEATTSWTLELDGGDVVTARVVITCLGLLSAPTPPRYEGMDDFEGESFHTHDWPFEPVEREGRRVGVIGTGATGIQVIADIADRVGELLVFQRRPNWSAPLGNAPITPEEMDEIRSRYDEIFAACAASETGFEHLPVRTGYDEATPEERRALWDRLYDEPGFGILLGNYIEVLTREEACRDLSDYVAERIRGRVHDPETAEKLIPTDHLFGTQRVPLESGYFEAFNHDHVHLIDLSEAPIERISAAGVVTTEREHPLDVLVYATGFDAVTGSFDRIEIEGVDGERLADRWSDGPTTQLGIAVHGFPNLLMVAGPQSASASSNFPRAIETSVEWVTDLVEHLRTTGAERVEADADAERAWTDHVVETYQLGLARSPRGWFAGYNSNVPGRPVGVPRHVVYSGGAKKYRRRLAECVAAGYDGFAIS